MCWCTPTMRTPWCGAPGCEGPPRSVLRDLVEQCQDLRNQLTMQERRLVDLKEAIIAQMHGADAVPVPGTALTVHYSPVVSQRLDVAALREDYAGLVEWYSAPSTTHRFSIRRTQVP